MDVVERAHAGHQFAQDERGPPRGEDLGRFRYRTELTIAGWHAGHLVTDRPERQYEKQTWFCVETSDDGQCAAGEPGSIF